MLTASLNEQDVAVLIDCLSEIHEFAVIDQFEWRELRFALANIVGDIRSQTPSVSIRIGSQFRKRFDLDDLLTDKFKEWESERLIDNAETRSANSILEFHLSNSGRSTDCFIGSSQASSSIMSFKYALGHPKAWEQYELQLCASPLNEVENLTLEDLVHSVVLSAYN